MSGTSKDTKRRDFLKSGLALAAGSAGLMGTKSLAAPADDKILNIAAGEIPSRPFGKTGHTLPILGMGGSAMVQLFHRAYGVKLLSMNERVETVRHGFERGIRYYDTAPVYGESQAILGRALADVRDQVYIATKYHFPNAENVRPTLETSLRQLKTDYVDCVQIHSPAIERVGFDGAMKIHAELVKLRDEGLLRYIGLTTHVAFETVDQMIQTDGFDQVLLAYGYFNKGMDTLLSHRNLEFRELCLAHAHERGMAIVAMKILGANILSHNAQNLVPDYAADRIGQLPAAAIRWVLQDKRIAMLNIGVSMPSDVDQNIETLKGDTAFTNEDRALLADFARQAYDADEITQLKTV